MRPFGPEVMALCTSGIAKGRNIAVALQALLVEVHRQGDVDGNDQLQVDGCVCASAGPAAAAARNSNSAPRQKASVFRISRAWPAVSH